MSNLFDLVFEFQPGSGSGRFNLQPDYSGSAFSLEVGMKMADKVLGKGMSDAGRLRALLALHWQAPTGAVVRWLRDMQKAGHLVGRLVGMGIVLVPLVSETRNIDDWDELF